MPYMGENKGSGVFYLEATVYSQFNQGEPRPIMARIDAPTLHIAKRVLLEDILAHGYYAHAIKMVDPKDIPNMPEDQDQGNQWQDQDNG